MKNSQDWADKKARELAGAAEEYLGPDLIFHHERAIAAALRQEREASERRGAAEEFAQFAAGLRLFATKRDVFAQDLLEGIALAIDRQVQRLLAGGKL